MSAAACFGAASAVAAPTTSLIDEGVSPSISASGRFVAYERGGQIYLRDTLLQTTERVDVSTAGVPANDFSFGPQVSARGRYVLFGSSATNLVAHDTNDFEDIFLRDRKLGTTKVVPKVTSFVNGYWRMSATGRYFVYAGPGHSPDIYRFDRPGTRCLGGGNTSTPRACVRARSLSGVRSLPAG